MGFMAMKENILIAIYEQTYEEMRDYRKIEWKIIIYLSSFLIGIYTTIINFPEKVEQVFKYAKETKVIYPIQISIVIIGLIGLLGFFTLLNIKMRFQSKFFTINWFYNKFNLPFCDYESLGGFHNFLQNFYNFWSLAWIPFLALLNIIYIVQILKLSYIWWLAILIIFFLTGVGSIILAYQQRIKSDKLYNNLLKISGTRNQKEKSVIQKVVK